MKEKTALVCEGGAMRCIYGAGVLDALLQEELNSFDLYLGVSAGACNLSSQVAGQFERNYRIFTRLMTDSRFFSWGHLLKGKPVMDLDWLWQAFGEEEPLDVPGCVAARETQGRTFVAVCTDAATGEPVYMEPTLANWLDVIRASSSLPLLYRSSVDVEGRLLLDGGASDPIPAQAAYERGARRIVVIRSRPAAYRKKKGFETRLLRWAYRKQPRLQAVAENRAVRYNQSVGWLENPPADAEVIHITPPESMQTRRTTQSSTALETDYATGLKDGHEAATAIRRLLQ